jgi:hypothetical protein
LIWIQIADDLRAQAFACIAAWLHRDLDGFHAVAGSDEKASVLLPVVIGELVSALEKCVGPAEVHRQVEEWLEVRAKRLAG